MGKPILAMATDQHKPRAVLPLMRGDGLSVATAETLDWLAMRSESGKGARNETIQGDV